MERRNLALLCAGVVCFWLFALAFGTAQDSGLRWVEAPAAAQTAVAGEEMQPAALTAAQPDLTLNCRAVCLIDQDTGTVLYEKNADQQMPIASITKVMTLLLTFEAIHDGRLTLDTLVPVSEHAYHMGGSQIWLEPGEQFTLDEMIKAICVSSANDAAVAVAELVGGSEQGFVQMMNDRAAELGMTNTTFHNACGLDTEGHLSTARDVAIMSRQILTTCPEVLHYTGIWTDTLRGGATQLVNTNKLLRRYNGITGLQTGEDRHHRRGWGVHQRQRHPRRAEPDRRGAGGTFQQRPVRSGHHPAGLWLCGMARGPAARHGRPASPYKGKGQRRGERATGIFRPAGKHPDAEGERGRAHRAAHPARRAGCTGAAGPGRGHGAHPGRGECAGRVRHLRGGRCAGDGFWHGAGPAVGHFDRAEWLKERFTV